MTEPVLRRSNEIEYETVDAAEALSKGVLIADDHGAPNFAIRRFVLEPGGEVPKHTNDVEHEQYVLEGEYTVGISDAPEAHRADGEAVDGDEEYEVEPGDSLLIPAGTVHWYRNESDERGAFICAVPNGDDEIELLE
ncbi:cupin domain-containing protein [Natrinema longum]|uniref:Cupin domain-containing protein n=1 Tax=Natrinema longum TaxID=370324 RepID=A0A8A2U6E7_9EURY|nr:cupin domain-containing protein [Natrinema longum]MBZ6494504.1 cupin domain-containing protein [Natrinema longum]QSW84173.1 cupin domain-containing protein [Natrinema longum]